MRRSIRIQYVAIVTGLLLAMIGLSVILNLCFYEKYYYYSKQKDIRSMYEKLEEILPEEGELTREQEMGLRRICDRDNLDILLIGANEENRFVFSRGNQIELGTVLLDYTYGERQADANTLYSTDTFEISLAVNEKDSEIYMESVGTVRDGNVFVIMRVPVQNLKDNIWLSNRFLLMSSLAILLAGIVIAAFLGRSLARPVTELSGIATRMADMDFTARYTGKEQNELGELGMSMNHLSQQLEETISGLKSANLSLQHEIKKKQEKEDMRREFLAGVSHELKTPIALISGYAEGLKEGVSDDPESREFYCTVIMEEAEKLDNMVHRMLRLNEIEEGEQPNEMVHFDIHTMLAGVMENTRLLFEREGITTEFEQSAPLYVWADEERMEEVFRNYLTNAIHYAEGEKKIRVWTESSGDTVRVNVFNTGKQIPEEEQKKIWLRFYKVDKARSRSYGGNGIGLSIVKAIMDSHGRECGTYNREDGVVFWFELDGSKQ